MLHKETPYVSLSVLLATLIISILFTVISYYSYRECSCKKCTKPATATIISNSTKYITVAGPNGGAVKISSKMASLAAYIADNKNEVNTDMANTDKSFWQSKFKTWREKMSQNSVAPSLTNFMDIVELSKIVKEN